MEEQVPVIISPLPIRPASMATVPSLLNQWAGSTNEQAEAHAELLAIMAPHRDTSASPVYRTLNPLPHDATFTTVAAAMISMAVAAAADSELRPRSYSVGDDRIATC